MMSIRKLVKTSLVTGACCIALNAPTVSAIVITQTHDAELLANTLIVPNTGITLIDFSLSGSIFEPQEDGYVFDNNNSPSNEESRSKEDKSNDTQEERDSLSIPTELAEITDTLDDNVTLSEGSLVSLSDNTGASSGNLTQTGIFNDGSGVFGLPNSNGIAFRVGGINGANANVGATGSSTNPVVSEQVSAPTSTPNEAQSIITGEEANVEPSQVDITFNANDDVYAISFVSVSVNDDPGLSVPSGVNNLTVILNGETVEGVNEPTTTPIDNPILPAGNESEAPTPPVVTSRIRFDIPVEPGSEGNTLTIIVENDNNNENQETILLASAEISGSETNSGDDHSSSGSNAGSNLVNNEDHSESGAEANDHSALGETELTPILPDPNNPTNEDGDFVLVLPEVEAFETIFIDPDVATGYTFTTESTDPTNPGLFASVTAPSPAVVNDPDGFILTYIDENGIEQVRDLAPSETFTFPTPVETFSITGIDPNLGLDPTQSGLFTTGVAFSTDAPADTLSVIQSPIIQFIADHTDVPEPDSLALIVVSMFGVLAYRRRVLRK